MWFHVEMICKSDDKYLRPNTKTLSIFFNKFIDKNNNKKWQKMEQKIEQNETKKLSLFGVNIFVNRSKKLLLFLSKIVKNVFQKHAIFISLFAQYITEDILYVFSYTKYIYIYIYICVWSRSVSVLGPKYWSL
jgi:hypothetical protein